MDKKIVDVGDLTGFVAEGAKPHEMAKILQKASVIADEPHFYMYINQIDNLFLQPAGIIGDGITNFFVRIPKSLKAEIYTKYKQVTLEMKAKQALPGHAIYVKDVENVRRYSIKNIHIEDGDAVVCVMKVGWKYGLYFDFTRDATEDGAWQDLGKLYNRLHFDRILENIQKHIQESEKPHIITEGKTDWRHIESARRELESGLLFGYPSSDDTLGDTGLLQVCQRLGKFGPHNKNKIIAIFDRDNPAIIKELTKQGDIESYQSWGNNVYSFAIPIPAHRKKYKNISVEMLYKEKDLRRTDNRGKRLYFDNEIKKEIIPGEPTRVVSIPSIEKLEYEKKVYDELADRIVDKDGVKLGLSKAAFAQLIFDGNEDFKDMDFFGYKEVFKIIKSILREE